MQFNRAELRRDFVHLLGIDACTQSPRPPEWPLGEVQLSPARQLRAPTGLKLAQPIKKKKLNCRWLQSAAKSDNGL
ncbi:hypothetical protein J1614_002054 [Plenodomus biglobosus]|nr:hypothetical protein J1614_002054 [Plenodomus biglobosus]